MRPSAAPPPRRGRSQAAHCPVGLEQFPRTAIGTSAFGSTGGAGHRLRGLQRRLPQRRNGPADRSEHEAVRLATAGLRPLERGTSDYGDPTLFGSLEHCG